MVIGAGAAAVTNGHRVVGKARDTTLPRHPVLVRPTSALSRHAHRMPGQITTAHHPPKCVLTGHGLLSKSALTDHSLRRCSRHAQDLSSHVLAVRNLHSKETVKQPVAGNVDSTDSGLI